MNRGPPSSKEHSKPATELLSIPTQLTALKGYFPRNNEQPERDMEIDFQPSSYDVICGRGRRSYETIGNRRFRITITLHLESYMAAKTKIEKSSVMIKIVNTIRDAGGHFLKWSQSRGRWFDIGDKAAREKVGHALRDSTPDMFKSLFEENSMPIDSENSSIDNEMSGEDSDTKPAATSDLPTQAGASLEGNTSTAGTTRNKRTRLYDPQQDGGLPRHDTNVTAIENTLQSSSIGDFNRPDAATDEYMPLRQFACCSRVDNSHSILETRVERNDSQSPQENESQSPQDGLVEMMQCGRLCDCSKCMDFDEVAKRCAEDLN